MKCAAIRAAVLILGTASLTDAALSRDRGQTHDSHPIAKVINMLQGLMAKTEMMGKVEAASYAKFESWCHTQTSTLTDAIEAEKASISELTDTVAGKTKEQSALEDQIEDLTQQIADLQASALKAQKVRAREADLFAAALDDYKSTVEAVDSALAELEDASTKAGGSFLQISQKAKQALALLSGFANPSQRSAIQGFLEEAVGAAKQPDSSERSIVPLLKSMKAEFEKEQHEAVKAESNAQSNFATSSKARDDATAATEGSKAHKETELAETETALADAQADLEDQRADKKADTASLRETETSCSAKKGEWEERSKTRELELEAMDAAIKILAKVTGVRTEAPSNPILPAAPVTQEGNSGSFLQLQASLAEPSQLKAVNLLKETAKLVHSRALERFAIELAAHVNEPFDEINGMIQKMIFRLMDEQKQEDVHKAWCDQELEKSHTMKENKGDKIEELDARIESEKTAVAQLVEEIKNAQEFISDLKGYTKEATEIRNLGKKENKEAIQEAEEAQAAILKAIDVLEAFYKESGEIEKEALVQEPVKVPDAPSTWDSGYTGISDPENQPHGIIGVLKAVNADFAKLEAETRCQESTDQHNYEEQISSAEIEKARRAKEVEMKENRKMKMSDEISRMTAARGNLNSEQEKAVQYLKDLESACVSGDSSYEKRKEARAKEIDALKQAQKTLAKPAAFLSKVEAHT